MALEPISKVLQEHSLQNTPNQKNYKELDEDKPLTPEQEREKFLLRYGGVTNLTNTFATMKRISGFEQTLQAFQDLVAGNVSWFTLLVYGGTGNGKSRCCEAAVIALYDKGIRTSRRKWSDIIRFQLKATFNGQRPNGLSYEEQFKVIRELKYLIIDDIGMGSTGGNWEWGELEDIIDYRLEHRLFTILTTNLDIKGIPPRIISRLRDTSKCRLVHNKASDQRPLLGQDNG